MSRAARAERAAEEIVVIAWSGGNQPAHLRIPAGRGLCGAAAAAGETVVVDDVLADPRYLKTFGSTRAEIVVPVVVDGAVRGLVDVESEQRGAFGDADRALLEERAAALAPLWADQPM